MKVLVTGGAGYIGSHCSRHFRDKGIDSIVLDNLSFGHREAVQEGRLVVGDIGDESLLRSLFREEAFDAVIHFAALADVADSVARPQFYYDTNVAKMETLLRVMADYGVQRMIFSSSAAVYGNPVYLPIDENHPLNPINPYGDSKMQGEALLQKYEELYGIRSVSLRYFNASGADSGRGLGESHQPEHHLIPLILQATLQKGKPLEIFGNDYDTKDGTCIRDFVHVMDLAEAHYLALEYLLSGGASCCYNLGSGKGFTILEIIKACEKITGKQVPYRFSGRRPGDPAILLASNKKIKESLKWEPVHSDIHNIISTAWDWERNRLY